MDGAKSLRPVGLGDSPTTRKTDENAEAVLSVLGRVRAPCLACYNNFAVSTLGPDLFFRFKVVFIPHFLRNCGVSLVVCLEGKNIFLSKRLF